MQQALRRSSVVPVGFVVESAFCNADRTVITVRPSQRIGLCPSCGMISRRVHSHYGRRVRDLPLSGRMVELVVIARRFRCDAVLCGRQIFTERFPDGVLVPSARRTSRLDGIVHHLGLVLGGRPAAIFAKRLMLPVSNDTLLRDNPAPFQVAHNTGVSVVPSPSPIIDADDLKQKQGSPLFAGMTPERACHFSSRCSTVRMSTSESVNGTGSSQHLALLSVCLVAGTIAPCLRGYALSAAIMMNRLSGEDLQKPLNGHGTDWVRKLEAAKAAMFRPERLIEFVLDRKPQFVLAASGPYQQGQKVINGVYFAPKHAETLLKSMAAAQAEALNARPPLQDLRDKPS